MEEAFLSHKRSRLPDNEYAHTSHPSSASTNHVDMLLLRVNLICEWDGSIQEIHSALLCALTAVVSKSVHLPFGVLISLTLC